MRLLRSTSSHRGFKFSQLEMSKPTLILSLAHHSFKCRSLSIVETVLYVLIASFKYELSDAPVYWNFAGVTYPATSKESKGPELWLNVSLVS